MTDIISFRSDWSLHDYSKKDIKFTETIDLYEIKFNFEGEEYNFTLPEDTLLDVKESDVKFNSKRVSQISSEDEVLIPFFSVHRHMAPIYTIGAMERREVVRKQRTIVKEKHLVKISSVSLIKEKVPCSVPFEIVHKLPVERPEPKTSLRPIIPVNTVCEEWIEN